VRRGDFSEAESGQAHHIAHCSRMELRYGQQFPHIVERRLVITCTWPDVTCA
jgi:hypothetical protein